MSSCMRGKNTMLYTLGYHVVCGPHLRALGSFIVELWRGHTSCCQTDHRLTNQSRKILICTGLAGPKNIKLRVLKC